MVRSVTLFPLFSPVNRLPAKAGRFAILDILSFFALTSFRRHFVPSSLRSRYHDCWYMYQTRQQPTSDKELLMKDTLLISLILILVLFADNISRVLTNMILGG